ncbi:CsiV family protein [Marinobacter sp.]|uniref:CsiV family protein n=1 Tax=Marinobacter sp. TaxID=50741 RepID=UPI00384A9225
MRSTGISCSGLTPLTFISGLILALASSALTAQEREQDEERHLYRAEIVVLERRIDPSQVEERMAGRIPPSPPEIEEKLWVVPEDGAAETTLELVPPERMHLSEPARRLEGSGRYRVLVTAAWQEDYPPDHKGEPMRVAVGNWLADAQQREIEGYISIDRLRFLHVTAALNHWQPAPVPPVTPEPLPPWAPGQVVPVPGSQGLLWDDPLILSRALVQPLELVTWLHETRRMRSGEIHFMDSPTIGVLVYFKRIRDAGAPEDEPSAPE